MACIEVPEFPPLPDIFPLTLEPPPLPVLDLSVDFCCRFQLIVDPMDLLALLGLAAPIKALLIASPEVSATIALINQNIAILNTYLDALPLDCPLE